MGTICSAEIHLHFIYIPTCTVLYNDSLLLCSDIRVTHIVAEVFTAVRGLRYVTNIEMNVSYVPKSSKLLFHHPERLIVLLFQAQGITVFVLWVCDFTVQSLRKKESSEIELLNHESESSKISSFRQQKRSPRSWLCLFLLLCGSLVRKKDLSGFSGCNPVSQWHPWVVKQP